MNKIRYQLAKHRNIWAKLIAIASIAFVTAPSIANSQSLDPEQILEDSFWGNLYRDGGETFFCNKAFKKKTPLISESYIYPQSAIREYLQCGTTRQCMRDNDRYRNIMSDLHNIVTANAYFEFKRNNTIFGILDTSVDADKCGTRKKLHVIEPPEHLKGDIARIIFYMHDRYGLPIIGNRSDLERWNQADPVSENELKRDAAVKQIQGASKFSIIKTTEVANSSANETLLSVN
jgi:deoxyribonuclease-1